LGQAGEKQDGWEKMAMQETVLVDEPVPSVLRITLNRPDQMNAYNHQLCSELCDAVEVFEKKDDYRVLVLTGSGRGFCSGGDIGGGDPDHKSYMGRQLGHGREMIEGMQRAVRKIYALDKPSIAMINGPAVAGGLALALSCDFRWASASAKLGDTSGKIGLLPDEGGAWLFPRVMGQERALRMSLLHEVYTADQALELGLISEVLADSELEDKTLSIAAQLANGAPLDMRLAKQMIRRSEHLTLEQSQTDAALAVEIANVSEDVREGVKAFFEKRPPKFSGK
jgi:enoyl-CoA hydratase/carnithine racemase